MCTIGQFHSVLEQFTAIVNMTRPMTKKYFRNKHRSIKEAVTVIANETMLDTAKE